jgi:hypothetical protein
MACKTDAVFAVGSVPHVPTLREDEHAHPVHAHRVGSHSTGGRMPHGAFTGSGPARRNCAAFGGRNAFAGSHPRHLGTGSSTVHNHKDRTNDA